MVWKSNDGEFHVYHDLIYTYINHISEVLINSSAHK